MGKHRGIYIYACEYVKFSTEQVSSGDLCYIKINVSFSSVAPDQDGAAYSCGHNKTRRPNAKAKDENGGQTPQVSNPNCATEL